MEHRNNNTRPNICKSLNDPRHLRVFVRIFSKRGDRNNASDMRGTNLISRSETSRLYEKPARFPFAPGGSREQRIVRVKWIKSNGHNVPTMYAHARTRTPSDQRRIESRATETNHRSLDRSVQSMPRVVKGRYDYKITVERSHAEPRELLRLECRGMQIEAQAAKRGDEWRHASQRAKNRWRSSPWNGRYPFRHPYDERKAHFSS